MTDTSNCIFDTDWWLDAVAPGAWSAVEVKRGGRVMARLPYVLVRQKFGLKVLTLPPLTKVLGPWLAPSNMKYAKRLAGEKDLMNALIDGLPDYDYFSQNFHDSVTNWLPFYWRGFEQTTWYTYVIEDLTGLDKVWDGTLANIRTDVRKARDRHKIRVRTDMGIDELMDVVDMTFERKKLKYPYDRGTIKRLDAACDARDARRIFMAEDSLGKIHAGIYLVWDDRSAYYLIGGGNPRLRNSGATSLLMWEAIRFASKVTRKFDFEGSINEPVERFFRAFGAKQKPYFNVSHVKSRRMKMVQIGREIKGFIRGWS